MMKLADDENTCRETNETMLSAVIHQDSPSALGYLARKELVFWTDIKDGVIWRQGKIFF